MSTIFTVGRFKNSQGANFCHDKLSLDDNARACKRLKYLKFTDSNFTKEKTETSDYHYHSIKQMRVFY